MSDDSKGLLGWFGKRKEGVIQSGMRTHALSVLDCVTELGNAMRAMEADDKSGALKAIERLYYLEHEADSQEDNLCNQMSIGELSPQEREDFMHFVKKTDSIANWCKEAAINLQLIIDTGAVIPVNIWNLLTATVSDLESEVNGLMNAIKILGTDGEGIAECIQSIKDQERRVDEAYMKIMKAILIADLDQKATILSINVLETLEEAADTCKGCAETINILFYAKRI